MKRSGRSSVGSSSSVSVARDLLRQLRSRATPNGPVGRLLDVVVNLDVAAAHRHGRRQRRVSLAHLARHDLVGVDVERRVTELRSSNSRARAAARTAPRAPPGRASASCRPTDDTSRAPPRSLPDSARTRHAAPRRAPALPPARAARVGQLRRKFFDRFDLALQLEPVIRHAPAHGRAATARCPRCRPARPPSRRRTARSESYGTCVPFDRRARIAELVGEVAQRRR